MSRYDQFFDFRIAEADDIGEIMYFIRVNWGQNHILANSREFFEYHFGRDDGGINVFLMCKKDRKIAGMIGFVPYSAKPGAKFFSCSIIKVAEGLPLPMCGIELMRRFFAYMDGYTEFGCGANAQTILPIYEKVFKRYSGKLKQFYLINNKRDQFHIITVPDHKKQITSSAGVHQYKMVKVKTLDDIEFDFDRRYKNLPYKEKSFLNKRYFHHPVFQYDVYGIKESSGYGGVLFTRKVHCKESSIILVVDFVGDIHCLGNIGEALENILVDENAECISFLEAGIPAEILEKSGFCAVYPEQTDVIIPTYFEPFVNANILNYYVSMEENLIIFKATGDQDNPKCMLKSSEMRFAY